MALALHERLRVGLNVSSMRSTGSGSGVQGRNLPASDLGASSGQNVDAVQVSEALWEAWRALRADAGEPLPSSGLKPRAASASEPVVSPSPGPLPKAAVPPQDSSAASRWKDFR